MILHTASWRAMAARHHAGDRTIAPVRISLGTPKFWPATVGFAYAPELAPAGVFGRDLPGDEFTKLYIERLDSIGVERIGARLVAIHAEHGRPLALCCFEAERADCHRGLAASWLEDHGLGPVTEVVPEPAHNPHTARSGQLPLSAQLRLDDQEDR